jgi:hypothetical protein
MMVARCSMLVGYLVPHRCEGRAMAACIKCARSYCDEHLSLTQAGLLCKACEQGRTQPLLLAATGAAALGALGAADLAGFSAAESTPLDDQDAFSDLS